MTKVTITDVANEVGISKTTVSRYINGKFDRINIKTQQAIQDAIDRLGYVPNQQARSLKSKKSKLIGLVIADMTNAYASYLISGMQEIFREQGYALMIFDSANDLEHEKQALLQARAANVDGLILQPLVQDSTQYQYLSENSLPVVLVDRQTEPQIWSSVTSDNFTASKEMAMRLKQKQYQRIIFLDRLDQNPWTNQLRLSGLTSVTTEAKMDLVYLQLTHANFDPLLAYLQAETTPKTAIFAANGQILINSLRWLKAHNIQIPNQVGITGYDDSTLGELIAPGITALVQRPQTIGAKTAETLLNLINSNNQQINQIEIPSQLIERHSL